MQVGHRRDVRLLSLRAQRSLGRIDAIVDVIGVGAVIAFRNELPCFFKVSECLRDGRTTVWRDGGEHPRPAWAKPRQKIYGPGAFRRLRLGDGACHGIYLKS